MINAIRIHTTVESEMLRIPELAALVGRRVEVIIVEEEGEAERVAAAPSVTRKRTLGGLQGKLQVPDDFDAPLPDEVLRAFEGDE